MPNFDELLKRISPTLKRITYRLNGHFTFFNDEDLYQEALMHLWQDFQAGELDDKTDSYILQGCYFHLKNYIRKALRGRVRLISLQALINNEEDATVRETLFLRDDDSRFIEHLDSKMLVEAILNNGLTQREKDILCLCSDGLTTREVGRRLGISHVRVVKLMARIRKKCNQARFML